MEKKKREESFWKSVRRGVNRFFRELEEESVSRSTRKPVDCCTPPVVPETAEKNRK